MQNVVRSHTHAHQADCVFIGEQKGRRLITLHQRVADIRIRDWSERHEFPSFGLGSVLYLVDHPVRTTEPVIRCNTAPERVPLLATACALTCRWQASQRLLSSHHAYIDVFLMTIP